MKTSQAWSMDIMIALVIFIGTIFVFYSILSGNQGDKTDELEKDASIVAKNALKMKNEKISQVDELLQEDYDELKKKLRVKNEFCIYLEDDEGNVIPIQDQSGVGSGKIKIGGEGCSPDCNDGIDNDGDGKIDFGTDLDNDPECVRIDDNDESN